MKRIRFWNNFFNNAIDFQSRFPKRVRLLANFTQLNRLLSESFRECQVLKWKLYDASHFQVKRIQLKVSKTSQNVDKQICTVCNFVLKLAISVRFWIKILHRLIFWKKKCFFYQSDSEEYFAFKKIVLVPITTYRRYIWQFCTLVKKMNPKKNWNRRKFSKKIFKKRAFQRNFFDNS